MSAISRAASAAGRVRATEPALLLLAAMVFIVQVGVAVMLPLLPLYAQSLGAAPVELGLLTSSFAITNAIGQLAAGFLAERFEMRRLLAAGIGSYAVANFLIALSGTAGALILFRSVAGLGGGVMLIGERLYLAQLVEPAGLGFANGLLSAAGSAGTVAGPALGGLVAGLDLRLPFILVGVTSAVATVGALFLPKPRRLTVPEGVADAEAALVQPPEAASVASRRQSRQLFTLLLVMLGLNAAFGGFITTYGPFAEEHLGWSTAQIGIVFALFGIGSILLGPWLARQADLRGRRNVALIGTLPVLAFSFAYWLELPEPILYGVSILAGAGVTTVSSAWFAMLADATEGGRRGRRFGLVAAISNLGIVIGATVAAVAWEASGNPGVGFIVAAVAVVVCALALLALPRDRPQPAIA